MSIRCVLAFSVFVDKGTPRHLFRRWFILSLDTMTNNDLLPALLLLVAFNVQVFGEDPVDFALPNHLWLLPCHPLKIPEAPGPLST